MPTLQILLARIEPLALALEVEHPQRVVRALGVPLHHRMPAAATRAVEEIANLERLLHAVSMCRLQDNPGQGSVWIVGQLLSSSSR